MGRDKQKKRRRDGTGVEAKDGDVGGSWLERLTKRKEWTLLLDVQVGRVKEEK